MCGFAAAVGAPGTVDPALLADIRDAMVHRGPDEEGIWVSDDRAVGFGHRRLSIIDLAHGHQPMLSHDGRHVLAYNGELYNHRLLRAELERAGHRFDTHCDTEVVLASYREWGDACVERFDGMFAFAVWDADRRRLFVARDRVGKKPLYYVETADGLLFASEIKALLRHPDVRPSVDRAALGHYLSFLATPAPQTLFAGIRKLAAGHCGSWSAREGLVLREWWRVPTGEELDISLDEAAARVRELFGAAVEKRMMSDVPFGVYLSGGVDSSANVAVMTDFTNQPIQTFSVSFSDEPSLDELGHARAIAERFATDHHEVILDDEAVMRSLPELVHHQDEPIADPVCVPLLHLARLTKDSGVTVVQVGEGSDEIFMGYRGYTDILRGAERLRALERVVPRPLLAAGVAAARPFLRGLKGELMLESVRHGVPPAHGVTGLTEREKSRLFGSRNNRIPAYAYLRSQVGSGRDTDEIAAVTLDAEMRLRLPELLLMRVDKMTMATSVEARAPFLDHALVEFAARLPVSLRWADGRGKLVLKRALDGVVPDEVLNRRKQGFGAPVWRWADSLREIAERELFREPILDYFDGRALRALADRPRTTRQGFELWTVLNFALWHRHFVEGDDLREDWALPQAVSVAR